LILLLAEEMEFLGVSDSAGHLITGGAVEETKGEWRKEEEESVGLVREVIHLLVYFGGFSGGSGAVENEIPIGTAVLPVKHVAMSVVMRLMKKQPHRSLFDLSESANSLIVYLIS